MREELNVPVQDDTPDLDVFHQSSVGSEVCELAKDMELKSIVQTSCTRRRFRIDTGTGIFEFSIDSGEIYTKYGVQPISEVEIELFTGETEEMLVKLKGPLGIFSEQQQHQPRS